MNIALILVSVNIALILVLVNILVNADIILVNANIILVNTNIIANYRFNIWSVKLLKTSNLTYVFKALR